MICPTFPELNLNQWGEELQGSLQGQRYPLGGTLELTERCNFSCVHCYINQPAADRAAKANELSTAQVMQIMDQMAEAGCLFLCLTGGEVFLRPDFAEIYLYARRLGMLVTVFSNGALLTPHLADVLASSRPFALEVTLYGATQATYERVTGVPGSFERCMRGIELLVERKMPLTLKTVLLTANRHELAEMKDLAERLGLKFRYDGTLWPRLDGGEQPYEYRLSLKEVLTLDREDADRQREWQKTAESFSGQLVRSEYIYSCGAGLQTFHIDSAGKMSICTMARRPAYDLQQMSFTDAWEQLGLLRQKTRQLDTACRTCTAGALCIQCPGWSQAVHGDDETPVDFICALGKLRSAQAQRLQV